MKDEAKIEELLTRAVEKVYPSRDFLKSKLASGERLTLYLGIDPTGPTLHLGHMIPLMKLREFQDLGHQAILLIGDFTGMIGDPTDKSAARKRQTRKEVLANAKLYKKQASKILRFSGANAAKLMYNSKWLAKMNLAQFLEVAGYTTLQRIEERDMFEKRKEEGKPVFTPEFLYPIMQGYDSVAMDVDGEVGGNDQTFNMLMGRDLLKSMKGKEKFVIATKLLTDPSGKKMGKTEGNMITLLDSADDMFGKVMSWTDEMIRPAFEILTRVPTEEIAKIVKAPNPRDAKERLAKEVVAFFFGKKKAEAAAKNFQRMFRQHEAPEAMNEFPVHGKMKITDVLVESGLASSKGEARRLMEQGAISVGHIVVKDITAETTAGVIIKKGKRHFVKTV
jgi:tyrosyl-tRNA synthetase